MLIEKTITDQAPVYKSSKKFRQHIKRQELREKNHEYILSCLLFVLYSIQRATGVVYPAQTTLGETIGRNRDTTRGLLKELTDRGWITGWEFRFYETCIYNFGDLTPQELAYKFRKIKRPIGFKLPPWLWGMIVGNLPPAQAYKLLKYDITHESSLKRGDRDKKYIENRKKQQKKQLRSKFGSPDPGLVNILIQKFGLNKQKAEFLARNNVQIISLAIEDAETYISKFQRKIHNPFGFLLSRCKHYYRSLKDKKLQTKKGPTTPTELLDWVKGALKKATNLKFIQSESEVNRSSINTYTRFLIHPKEPEQSKIFFWKKIEGYWVDKEIPFKNPRFQELVTEFLVLHTNPFVPPQ